MTLEPPVLVTVSESDLLLPTVTLPKPSVVGFAPSVPCETPVPDSGMFRVGFEAFEVMLILPLAPVAVGGVNVTLKVVLCPAVRINGVVIPLMLNPLPLMLA